MFVDWYLRGSPLDAMQRALLEDHAPMLHRSFRWGYRMVLILCGLGTAYATFIAELVDPVRLLVSTELVSRAQLSWCTGWSWWSLTVMQVFAFAVLCQTGACLIVPLFLYGVAPLYRLAGFTSKLHRDSMTVKPRTAAGVSFKSIPTKAPSSPWTWR